NFILPLILLSSRSERIIGGPFRLLQGGTAMTLKPQLPPNVRDLNDHLQICFNRDWYEELAKRLEQNGPWDRWPFYQLAYEAEEAQAIHRFDDLQCLSHLSQLTPLPHQLDTARKVITEMRG